MHSHSHRRPSRWEWAAVLVRLFARNRGMRKIYRGDPIPTGPMETYAEPGEAYREDPYARMALDPQRRYPKVAPNAETMLDMYGTRAAGRPYLNPILTGDER